MVNSLVLKFPQSLPQVDLKKGPGQGVFGELYVIRRSVGPRDEQSGRIHSRTGDLLSG